jgi:superfamily II DNA or RNA helicase
LLELRPHQIEVINALNEGFKTHQRQILCAVTGFGKTECAMAIMQEAAKEGKKVAMVLDRIVLVEQTSIRLSKYAIPHGVLQSQHWRYRPYEPIQICSSQTLARRKIPLDIDILIVDEAHVMYKSTIDYIRDNPTMKVVGLTATPFTKGLADIYTNVIGAQPMSNLVEDGWVVPMKVFIAKEIDMTGAAKNSFGEWDARDASERGMKIVGDVVQEWTKKTYEIYGEPRKTIVFCAGVEHGRELVDQFAKAGYNFVSISYKEDDEFKRSTIEDFSKPDTTIHGLIATDILTRGFDVSDVHIGISARPFSKSFSSHVQQIGRVLRPHEGKEFGVWLDHSGNFLRFRNDWDDLYHDGVTELKAGGETTKREPTEREKKEAKCPKCLALWTSKDNTCSSCGHVRQVFQGITSIAGKLEELQESNRKLQIANTDFFAELQYYGRTKGYKEGWAAIKYKEKFGAYPNGLRVAPKPPSTQTLKWIKSRTIAYVKGKQAQQRIAA